ncbi:ArdC family protein [Paracoccus litorisediminis]|uniref:ArdC family protein n=1 Tax=Paracoccus litorisediminis TaxID=2006130 RepID=UPI00372E3CAA
MAFDLYQQVTDSIIASLAAGSPAWRKPWTGERKAAQMPLRGNGEAYRGINVLMLWLAASAQGYGSAYWFTYKQAEAAGGQVRKGEKSATVVKYGTLAREDEDSGAEKRIPFLKSYRVFNADQIDGLPEEFHASAAEPIRDLGTKPDPRLEAFFAATGADIRVTDELQAYYDPQADYIHMPPISSFYDAAGFYGTLAHEACHWSGHGNRLDRRGRFAARQAYAFEELIAEIGNCMLCAQLGLTPDFGHSAAYLEGWLRL